MENRIFIAFEAPDFLKKYEESLETKHEDPFKSKEPEDLILGFVVDTNEPYSSYTRILLSKTGKMGTFVIVSSENYHKVDPFKEGSPFDNIDDTLWDCDAMFAIDKYSANILGILNTEFMKQDQYSYESLVVKDVFPVNKQLWDVEDEFSVVVENAYAGIAHFEEAFNAKKLFKEMFEDDATAESAWSQFFFAATIMPAIMTPLINGIRASERKKLLNSLYCPGDFLMLFGLPALQTWLKSRFQWKELYIDSKDYTVISNSIYSYFDYEKKLIKPGRNEPCPCGSGKKYKQCCGRK